MNIKILAFGIAKDIIGAREMTLQIAEGSDVGGLKEHLVNQYADFGRLKSLALAVNEEYAHDSLMLTSDDEVVIIPPVSGG
ncbi:MAG: MoaD/ThiS family protein [Saprospiraceae bacterium]|nr:MoaD/ThiS family protein [Saprospiraceae bacterium]